MLLIISCSSSSTLHYDQNSNFISEREYAKVKYEEELFTWMYKEKGNTVLTLHEFVYEPYSLSHASFTENLNKITRREFPDSTIFLIKYIYYNDLCSQFSTNNWDGEKVTFEKYFNFDPERKHLEKKYDNLVYLIFFEEEINIENNLDSKMEFLFQDQGKFLRNTIFKKPALCGSYALIKPNGQLLVRNGEHDITAFAQHLKPENWKQFFPEEN